MLEIQCSCSLRCSCSVRPGRCKKAPRAPSTSSRARLPPAPCRSGSTSPRPAVPAAECLLIAYDAWGLLSSSPTGRTRLANARRRLLWWPMKLVIPGAFALLRRRRAGRDHQGGRLAGRRAAYAGAARSPLVEAFLPPTWRGDGSRRCRLPAGRLSGLLLAGGVGLVFGWLGNRARLLTPALLQALPDRVFGS